MNFVSRNTIPLFCLIFTPGLWSGYATTLDTLRHFDVQPLGSYSALWGYTAPDGREYAIIGVNGSSGVPYPGGTSIIDITDAPVVQQVAFIGGPNSAWREMKTYKHYAYVVTEAGGGVQIINLSQLPDTAWLVKSFNYTSGGKNIQRVHSVSLHDGFLYLNGCANWSPGGTVIFDLRNDPENPVYAGEYQPAYLHDVYVLRDTIYGSAINGEGLYIADARNKASISTIGLISYAGSGTHNAWVTKDRQYVISTDEIGTTAKTLKFWDIGSLPAIPSSPASTYTPAPGQIEHNVTVRGDYAYVAWYSAGVQVVNVTNPASPANAGGYDTSPTTSGYNGAWAVYPYFPSGKIIASDIQNGLWVFSFSDLAPRMPVSLLEPSDGQFLTVPGDQVFRWTRTADPDKDPHSYALSITGPGIDTVVHVAESTHTFGGFLDGQTYQWTVTTLDEFNVTASADTFAFTYALQPPAIPVLSSPPDGALDQPLSVTLSWSAAVGASSYRVQVATDSTFALLLVDDSTVTGTSRPVTMPSHDTEYFWRVGAMNSIGASGYSAIWDFRTVTAPPAAPVLLSPPDAAGDQPTSLDILWGASNGATGYHLQIAIDSLFAVLYASDSTLTDTSYHVNGLSNLTDYYWRIRAKNQGGYGGFSMPFRFATVIALPGVPLPVHPGDGAAGQPTSLDIRWHVSTFASTYHLQLSPDSLFPTGINDSTLVDTVRHCDSLEVGTTYYWRVRGKNSAGPGDWSETRVFTTSLQVTAQYMVVEGWNLIALPLQVEDPRTGVIFPEAGSDAFAFHPVSGYVQRDSLVNGAGYWLKFKTNLQVELTGDIRVADTVAIVEGWNLIGALSDSLAVSAIGEVPPGLVTSAFFAYNGVGYAAVDTLLPSVGYWVKAGQNGFLIFPALPDTTDSASRTSTGNDGPDGKRPVRTSPNDQKEQVR